MTTAAARPDYQRFLDGIRAAPDDDLRRLVFADWLEEHGEEKRAVFVRQQVAGKLAPLRLTWLVPFEGFFGCQPHQCGMVAEKYRAWAQSPDGRRVTFQRGFAVGVRGPLAAMLKHLPAMSRLEPLTAAGVAVTDREPLTGLGSDGGPSGWIVKRDWTPTDYRGHLPWDIGCHLPGRRKVGKRTDVVQYAVGYPNPAAAMSALHAAVWSVSGGGSATAHAPSPATARTAARNSSGSTPSSVGGRVTVTTSPVRRSAPRTVTDQSGE